MFIEVEWILRVLLPYVVGKVETPKLLKRGRRPFFLVAQDLFDDLQAVFQFHPAPYLFKLNTRSLLHYDVLSPHSVALGSRIPGVNLWDWSREDVAGL